MDQQDRNGRKFNVKAFSTDVIWFSFGQTVLLIIGFIQSLIIPKYLSTTDYGYWQFFLLGMTYIGILHLGFLDGILVRWAGKELKELVDEIPTAFRFICIELAVIIGFIILFLWLFEIPSKEIVLAVLFNAFIVNLLFFFLFIAQATKRFKLVTAANIGKGLLFLFIILMIFFKGYFSYVHLILATMVTGIIIILFFIYYFRDCLFHHVASEKSLFQYGKENIGIGLFILLGNFIAVFLATIDRLTVGWFFPINQFAIYAFAMTVCGLAMVFLQAVAQVFFPYISGSSNEGRTKAYTLLRPVLVLFWAGVLMVYFPFSAWIGYYLPQYVQSLPLMAILFCTIGFSGQIQILHTNFFKVYRKQRVYFIIAGISLIGAVFFNILAVFFFGTLIAVAAITIVSFSLWYLLNEAILRNIVDRPFKEIGWWTIVIGAYIGVFLGAYALTDTWIMGLGIYIVLFTGITAFFLRREMQYIWSITRKIIKRKKST